MTECSITCYPVIVYPLGKILFQIQPVFRKNLSITVLPLDLVFLYCFIFSFIIIIFFTFPDSDKWAKNKSDPRPALLHWNSCWKQAETSPVLKTSQQKHLVVTVAFLTLFYTVTERFKYYSEPAVAGKLWWQGQKQCVQKKTDILSCRKGMN